MRTGISLAVTLAIRRHLKAVAANRNSPRKHAWRAQNVLLSAAGVGTNEIMRQTGKSKTRVWRWQERFRARKPFTWTADPDKIIAAVKRGHQVLDSIH